MAAVCAACLEPITRGDPFVLSGTEVFHRSCSRDIASSLGARMKLEIQRLKGEVLRERKDGAAARVAAQSAEFDERRLLDRIAKLESDLASAKEQRETDVSTRRAAERANAQLARERTRLSENLDAVERLTRNQADTIAARDAEITRLRNELITVAKDKIPLPVDADPRDATEIRFSLLELDET